MRIETVLTHQDGRQMVRLSCGSEPGHDGTIALIEGQGLCMAESFPDQLAAEAWLHRMFRRLFPQHDCGFGCIRDPGCEFLATPATLARLAQPTG